MDQIYHHVKVEGEGRVSTVTTAKCCQMIMVITPSSFEWLVSAIGISS